MKARAFLEEWLQIVRGGNTPSQPAGLDERFYGQLIARDKQIAEAAKEVKACLHSAKLSKVFAICDEMLVQHPGHALFEGLRLEAQNKERELRFKYIENLCREVESSPDLEWRVTHLQHALSRHPAESQIVQLLKNATAKRTFIHLLLADARTGESCEKYGESLERLYTIRECHPSMPGLARDIQRVELLFESQCRTQRRKELTDDIYRLLSAQEYDRAVSRAANAVAEFPNDDEMLAIERCAHEKGQRAAEVQRLIQSGLASLGERDIDGALRSFRTARNLDPGNLQIMNLLGASLIQKIRMVIGHDDAAANLLLAEAKELIPNHPQIRALSGDIDSGSDDDVTAEPIDDRTEEPIPPAEERFTSTAIRTFFTGLRPALTRFWFRTCNEAKNVAGRAHSILTHPSLERLASGKTAFAALVMLSALVVAWSAYTFVHSRRSAPPEVVAVLPTPVHISALPDGAEVVINGKKTGQSRVQTELPPGNHTVSVHMPGYETQTLPLALTSEPRALTIALRPTALDLTILTDQPNASMWMDDEPKGTVMESGSVISGISPGVHRLKVRSPAGEATAVFDFQPGQPPSPVSLPMQRTPAVLFVGSSQEKLRVECNCAPASLSIDALRQSIRATGLELNLAEGDHPAELSVLGGKKLMVRGSRVPSATVALYWGRRIAAATPSVDALLREAAAMIDNRNYKAASIKVSQVLSANPGDDRAPILQKRLQRLMVIDP